MKRSFLTKYAAGHAFLRRFRVAAQLAGPLFLFGCTVGPNYVRPPADAPVSYKELGDWKPVQPSDQFGRGSWWEVYEDPQLNELEAQIDVSNFNLKAQQERFEQARAAIRISRSNYYPTVTGGASASENQISTNRPQFKSGASTTRFPPCRSKKLATRPATTFGIKPGKVYGLEGGCVSIAAKNASSQ